MVDHIPDQLLNEIFIKLPLQSLVRSISVCKSWHALITDPEFVTMHYNYLNNTRKHKSFFIRYYDQKQSMEHYTIRNDDESFSEKFDQIEFPYKICYGDLKIVGSCCGLVCLCHEEFGCFVSIVLWNPSIRKWLPVPIQPHKFVLGFGVCDVTNDHKLVRLVYDLKDSEFNLELPLTPLVEVYTLSAGSWRGIKATAPSCYMDLDKWSQVFVFGSVHWIAFDENGKEGGNRNLVVSFHMGNEVFHELILPDSLATECMNNLNITVLENSLAALKYTIMGNPRTLLEFCCVWVMKEYGVAESWTKLFNVRLETRYTTLGFRKDGQVIFPFRDSGVVSCDSETGKKKNLGITARILHSTFYIGAYMESLVLLSGGKRSIPRRYAKFLCSLRNRDAVKLLQ